MQDAAAVPDAPRETAAAATGPVGIHSPWQRQPAAAIGRLPAEAACAVLGFADVVTAGSLVGSVCADAARSHHLWRPVQRYLVQQRCVWLCPCQHWLWEVPLRLFQGKMKTSGAVTVCVLPACSCACVLSGRHSCVRLSGCVLAKLGLVFGALL